jgi:hypothetical protein
MKTIRYRIEWKRENPNDSERKQIPTEFNQPELDFIVLTMAKTKCKNAFVNDVQNIFKYPLRAKVEPTFVNLEALPSTYLTVGLLFEF